MNFPKTKELTGLTGFYENFDEGTVLLCRPYRRLRLPGRAGGRPRGVEIARQETFGRTHSTTYQTEPLFKSVVLIHRSPT